VIFGVGFIFSSSEPAGRQRYNGESRAVDDCGLGFPFGSQEPAGRRRYEGVQEFCVTADCIGVTSALQFCTFYVDGLLLGIDVQHVQEVILNQPMTRVPLMPAVLRGLINLRGQIIPAIDLRRKLELSERADDGLSINVVVRTAGGVVSLLVDQIGDVRNVAEEDFARPPETLRGAARELVSGVYKLPNELLLVLNTERAASTNVETNKAA
jgi:purine-binding chemotaxis protein CheW